MTLLNMCNATMGHVKQAVHIGCDSVGLFHILDSVWDDKKAKQLGSVLQKLRHENGLSQESLAYQAGITKNQLQLIEAGRSTGRKGEAGPSNPRMSTLAGLASVLGVTVTELLEASHI